jgi:hypothetical protein
MCMSRVEGSLIITANAQTTWLVAFCIRFPVSTATLCAVAFDRGIPPSMTGDNAWLYRVATNLEEAG